MYTKRLQLGGTVTLIGKEGKNLNPKQIVAAIVLLGCNSFANNLLSLD